MIRTHGAVDAVLAGWCYPADLVNKCTDSQLGYVTKPVEVMMLTCTGSCCACTPTYATALLQRQGAVPH